MLFSSNGVVIGLGKVSQRTFHRSARDVVIGKEPIAFGNCFVVIFEDQIKTATVAFRIPGTAGVIQELRAPFKRSHYPSAIGSREFALPLMNRVSEHIRE